MRGKQLCAISARFLFLGVLTMGAFAYNPPVGGENLFRYGHADLLSGATSIAGGGIFNVAPESVVLNPALVAGIQRVSLDAGYAGLIQTKTKVALGNSFQFGMLFPTRWGVLSGGFQGTFLNMDDISVGNSVLLRFNFARDITDNLYVGALVYTGINRGNGNDFAVGIDFGVLYRLGTLGALEDVRIGVALADLGKNYKTDSFGIDATESNGFFPGIITPKAGFAAAFPSFGNEKKMKAGFNVDVAFPSAQNMLFEAGAQLAYRAKSVEVTLSTGWQLNLREVIEGYDSALPAVGLSVKFIANTSRSEFLSGKGWQQTDVAVSGMWKPLHEDVQLVSFGMTANLGTKDTEPPVIKLEEGEIK